METTMGVAPKRKPDWSAWEGYSAGEFPLERYLGGGDRSAVFLTAASSEKAAIKLVPADQVQAAELVARWNRVARLTHPHLVRIISTGTCVMANTPLAYLVMEYAEEDLAAVIGERPLSAEETLEMVRPVADALAYLHGWELVHGRLKPSNIVAVKDTVKISCDSVAAGDPAEDVSALAGTMVQALTQRNANVSRKDSVDTLPQPFQEIARNCLCSDPRLRWSSAQIVSWLDSWSQSSPHPVPAAVTGAAAKMRKLGYYFAAFAALILVAVIIGRLMMRRVPTPAPATSANVAHPAPSLVPPAPSSLPPQSSTTSGQTAPTTAQPIPSARVPRVSHEMADAAGVTHQVLPDIPAKARSTIHGRPKVVIRVIVDPSGNVTDAKVERSFSPYFSRLALTAARHWQFVPAEGAGRREWVLRFEITPSVTKVVSKEQTAP